MLRKGFPPSKVTIPEGTIPSDHLSYLSEEEIPNEEDEIPEDEFDFDPDKNIDVDEVEE